jgi:serine/threonine protein kinase/Tfp pilus assembly protein PilZ
MDNYSTPNTAEQQQLLGRVLAGVYRIEEVIATGATAVVFRGTNIRLEQPLAIKVLSGSVVANASLISRFEAEAKVQAKLHHPNIVSVYDFVADGDVRAIAMEYVDGVGLDHLMYELAQPMDLARIKQLMTPVMEAVGYAHEQGIIHRDLKPSNILVAQVGPREYPKVMDFGIAKVLAEEVSITAPGAMLGTLLFMSPEQCKALKTVDARSDVYSLGVSLYQMATGMVPFYSESAFDIMLAHVQSPPVAPRELAPHIPPKLETVILKALEKDPEQRFSTIEEMAAALNHATGSFAAVGSPKAQPAATGSTSQARSTAPLRGMTNGTTAPTSESSAETEVQMVEASPGETSPRTEGQRPAAQTPRKRTGPQRTLNLDGLSAPGMRGNARPPRRESHAGPAESIAVGSRLRAGRPPVASTKEATRGSSGSNAVALPEEVEHASWLRLHLSGPSETEWRRHYEPNLAGGGLFVPTNEPPDVGTTVRVEVSFANGPRSFMTGVVTWRRPPTRDPRTRAGVGVQIHPSERQKFQYINRWVLGSASDQRRQRRLPIKLRVAYSARTGRRVNFTRDLSPNGVFLRSRELLDAGTPIELLLLPPEGKRAIRVRGRVCRLVRGPEDRGMGICLDFHSETERENFAAFVTLLEQRFLRGELSEDLLF